MTTGRSASSSWSGLPSAPRGVPQIEVTFDIDANGIVNVSAKDMATGKEQKITISNSSGLSKDEVAKMVKDAESHAADDKARRELIDARNQGDALAYSVEKTLNENRAKVPAEVAGTRRDGHRRPARGVEDGGRGADSQGHRGAAAAVARDGGADVQAVADAAGRGGARRGGLRN